ncbi:MAG: hypothetical protein QM270_10900 [Bacillota bacterium]|nr:hypothetical protein [Bacillota bacterium]
MVKTKRKGGADKILNTESGGSQHSITRRPDHEGAVSGQVRDFSKKEFGLLAVLTTKGLFLVRFETFPKKDLDYSLS